MSLTHEQKQQWERKTKPWRISYRDNSPAVGKIPEGTNLNSQQRVALSSLRLNKLDSWVLPANQMQATSIKWARASLLSTERLAMLWRDIMAKYFQMKITKIYSRGLDWLLLLFAVNMILDNTSSVSILGLGVEYFVVAFLQILYQVTN